MAINFGNVARTLTLGRDITPGFNINARAGGGIPFISRGNGSTGIAPAQQGYVLGASTTADQGQPQPVDQSSGVYTGGQGGGNGTDLSSYDQGINQYNDQINSLTPALNNALGQAGNQYQSTLNSLNQNKAQTDQQYTQNKTGNQQDFVTNKNTIKTNTGQTISSLSRLAGSRGASGQSAIDYARLLAAGQGTQQLSGASTAFGKNQQALDQSYGTYMQGYNQNLKSAEDQKYNDESTAKANNASSRASLLQGLATLVNQRTSAAGGSGVGASQGYINQAKQAVAEANQYSVPRPVAAQTPLVYRAPELSTYTANPTQIAAGAGAGSPADTVTPILSALLGNNRDKQLVGA